MFESFFDFDNDGGVGGAEMAAGFALAASIMDDECNGREDELRSSLEIAGLDEFELSMMDGDARERLLEENDLNPFDYDELLGS